MISPKTKVILYSVDAEEYRLEKLENRGPGEFPVCTIQHFFKTVLQLAEEVFPNIKGNPFWQEVDWDKIQMQNAQEVEQ